MMFHTHKIVFMLVVQKADTHFICDMLPTFGFLLRYVKLMSDMSRILRKIHWMDMTKGNCIQ